MFNQVNPESKRSQIGFYCLEDLVPENHLLRQIESSIDFSFIYGIVKDSYSSTTGRPSLDPVMLVKIPIIQTLYGIRSMRQTIKDIEVNVAYRWFLGLKLEDKVPHFSTYGKNYVRRFQDKQLIEEIFKHILQQCIFAGYVDASELFVDGTHIKAAANKGTSKNQLSSIISKKEETLALQFPARVPVFPTFLSLLSGEF